MDAAWKETEHDLTGTETRKEQTVILVCVSQRSRTAGRSRWQEGSRPWMFSKDRTEMGVSRLITVLVGLLSGCQAIRVEDANRYMDHILQAGMPEMSAQYDLDPVHVVRYTTTFGRFDLLRADMKKATVGGLVRLSRTGDCEVPNPSTVKCRISLNTVTVNTTGDVQFMGSWPPVQVRSHAKITGNAEFRITSYGRWPYDVSCKLHGYPEVALNFSSLHQLPLPEPENPTVGLGIVTRCYTTEMWMLLNRVLERPYCEALQMLYLPFPHNKRYPTGKSDTNFH